MCDASIPKHILAEEERHMMQTTAETPTKIPQHVVDQMENEWRQIRTQRENPRPARLPSQNDA